MTNRGTWILLVVIVVTAGFCASRARVNSTPSGKPLPRSASRVGFTSCRATTTAASTPSPVRLNSSPSSTSPATPAPTTSPTSEIAALRAIRQDGAGLLRDRQHRGLPAGVPDPARRRRPDLIAQPLGGLAGRVLRPVLGRAVVGPGHPAAGRPGAASRLRRRLPGHPAGVRGASTSPGARARPGQPGPRDGRPDRPDQPVRQGAVARAS